ncbi:MAG: hypothetical protein ABR575_02260 [Actinomycetota bacterium]
MLAGLTCWALVGALGAGASAAPPKTVWKDDVGDATLQGQTPDIGSFGFDLTKGSIAKDKSDLVFTIGHSAMPPSGTLPEGFRFMWAFAVGSKTYRITAKSADIGKPDLLAGQTTERVGRVDATGHFRLEGDCATGETIGVLAPLNCQPLAYLQGAFDAAAATITVTVPMKLVKAKPGSVVGPGLGDAIAICGICWVSHTAERSHQDTVIDLATMSSTWKVPRK